jgi:UPF0755 protein
MLRRLRSLFVIALVLVALPAGLFAYYAFTSVPLKESPLQFSLKAGSSLRSAARQMTEAGALPDAIRFEMLGRLLGQAQQLKAGNYEIQAPITPYELLHKITSGGYSQDAVTFVEGWAFRDVRKALNDHATVRHDSRVMTDAEIVERLGINGQSAPEGLFFPDTYHFSAGESDLSILRRAHVLMTKQLAAAWEKRADGLPLQTPYEALTLASIVEKETGRAEDRTLISAVFINRLKRGMRLQTDPTVIYGLGESFDGNLRKHHLLTDGPYNTYTRAGMPPTPIAMPGLASINAALHPADTRALYFVARGDGTSQFSQTLEEHDRAVTKYQRSGRK